MTDAQLARASGYITDLAAMCRLALASVEPPTATDETNPGIDDLLSDVQAIKCAVMAYQQGQGYGEHIDAAFDALNEAWGHLALIKASA